MPLRNASKGGNIIIAQINLIYLRDEQMNNLLILGRGQYSYIIEEIAEESFDKIDFLDDNFKDAVGRINDYELLKGKYGYAVVAIGNASARLDLTERLKKAGYKIATLVSKKAHISRSAKIGEGCIIEPMAVVNPNTVIGKCCIISAGAVVNHNSVVGNGCHIDCNATIASNVVIEEKTKITYGTVYKN